MTNSLDIPKGEFHSIFVPCKCTDASAHSMSFAYVEFAEPEHIDAALAMDNSLFRGRLIKVNTFNHNLYQP